MAESFPKLRQARERLRERADEIITQMLETVTEAREAGDYKSAVAGLTWLLEHMPAAEDGTRVVDSSVDKQPKGLGEGKGPTIKIGLIGPQLKALPAAQPVIEVDGEVEDS